MKTIFDKSNDWLCLLVIGALCTSRPVMAAEAPSQGKIIPPNASAWIPPGLPQPPAEGPALCVGNYLKPEQGKAVLDYALSVCTNRSSWEAVCRSGPPEHSEGSGLIPLPRRTPLNPTFRNRRTHDGVLLENVTFEPIPGYYATAICIAH